MVNAEIDAMHEPFNLFRQWPRLDTNFSVLFFGSRLRLCATKIVGGARQLRLKAQRRLEFSNAFFRFPGGEQGQPEIGMSLGVVRIHPKRFVELPNSLWYSAHQLQGECKVSPNVRIFGRKLGGATDFLKRGLIVVLLP